MTPRRRYGLYGPAPLRVFTSPRGISFVYAGGVGHINLWSPIWRAECRLCGTEVRPYIPFFLMSLVQTDMIGFANASDAGDEARTHLVQKHPAHPMVL